MIPMRKYLTIILFFLSISVFCQESNKKEEKCFVNSIEEVVNKELEVQMIMYLFCMNIKQIWQNYS